MERTIKVEMQHHLAPEDLLERVMRLIKSIDDTYPVEAKWNSENYTEIQFEVIKGLGKGITGTLHLEPNRVAIELQLTFVHQTVSAGIKEEIEEIMHEAIHGTQG